MSLSPSLTIGSVNGGGELSPLFSLFDHRWNVAERLPNQSYSSIRDKIGSAHTTKGDTGDFPVGISTQLNDAPVVQWTIGVMNQEQTTPDLGIAEPYTILLVGRFRAIDTAYRYGFADTKDARPRFAVKTTDAIFFSVQTRTLTWTPNTNPHTWLFEVLANGAVKVWVDGAIVLNSTFGLGGLGTLALGANDVGADSPSFSMAELLIKGGVLTTAEKNTALEEIRKVYAIAYTPIS
jgi:hypothetical protein